MLLHERISSLNDSDEENDNRHNKEKMNESSEDMETKESEKPENNENSCDCCKHDVKGLPSNTSAQSGGVVYSMTQHEVAFFHLFVEKRNSTSSQKPFFLRPDSS